MDNASPAAPAMVVLISGSGSNLQALIDATASGFIPGRIAAVISNNPDALGLQRAEQAGIATQVIAHRAYARREDFDQALMQAIDPHQPALVVLAGFMRILTPGFVTHYLGRLLNIHPSLLPALRGLHTHERALAEGLSVHGCSVHFVNQELDGGPVIMQARVPVLPDDTPQSLAARVLIQEHRLYPAVVRLFCQGRLRLDAQGVWLDQQRLEHPLDLARVAL